MKRNHILVWVRRMIEMFLNCSCLARSVNLFRRPSLKISNWLLPSFEFLGSLLVFEIFSLVMMVTAPVWSNEKKSYPCLSSSYVWKDSSCSCSVRYVNHFCHPNLEIGNWTLPNSEFLGYLEVWWLFLLISVRSRMVHHISELGTVVSVSFCMSNFTRFRDLFACDDDYRPSLK